MCFGLWKETNVPGENQDVKSEFVLLSDNSTTHLTTVSPRQLVYFEILFFLDNQEMAIAEREKVDYMPKSSVAGLKLGPWGIVACKTAGIHSESI